VCVWWYGVCCVCADRSECGARGLWGCLGGVWWCLGPSVASRDLKPFFVCEAVALVCPCEAAKKSENVHTARTHRVGQRGTVPVVLLPRWNLPARPRPKFQKKSVRSQDRTPTRPRAPPAARNVGLGPMGSSVQQSGLQSMARGPPTQHCKLQTQHCKLQCCRNATLLRIQF
jgi:hypothetical protein